MRSLQPGHDHYNARRDSSFWLRRFDRAVNPVLSEIPSKVQSSFTTGSYTPKVGLFSRKSHFFMVKRFVPSKFYHAFQILKRILRHRKRAEVLFLPPVKVLPLRLLRPGKTGILQPEQFLFATGKFAGSLRGVSFPRLQILSDNFRNFGAEI